MPSTALQGPEREEAKTEDAGPKRSAKRARGNGGKCPHNRQRSRCKDCGGMGICEHNRQKSKCRECGGASICPHQRVRSRCKDCGGSSICPHQRLKSRCQHCGGSSLCQHGRRKEECKECGGSRICEHKRIRGQCRECNERRVCIHGQPKNRCAECLNQPSKVPFLKTSPATVATATPGWELMSSEGREGAAGVPPRPTRTATDDRDKAKSKREALTRGEGGRHKGAKKGGDKYAPPLSETDIFATVEMVKDVSSVLIWEGVWREDKKHGEGRLGG